MPSLPQNLPPSHNIHNSCVLLNVNVNRVCGVGGGALSALEEMNNHFCTGRHVGGIRYSFEAQPMWETAASVCNGGAATMWPTGCCSNKMHFRQSLWRYRAHWMRLRAIKSNSVCFSGTLKQVESLNYPKSVQYVIQNQWHFKFPCNIFIYLSAA